MGGGGGGCGPVRERGRRAVPGTHQILEVRQQLATDSATQTGGSTDFESS